VTSDFFPFFLLYGFCLSSGIYMIVSLFDKEKKMRQYMFLAGVGPLPYYFGLFFADYSLFLITELIFTGFVWLMQLQAFSDQIF
jgi:ABC-type multidrug transport system permease subunit